MGEKIKKNNKQNHGQIKMLDSQADIRLIKPLFFM